MKMVLREVVTCACYSRCSSRGPKCMTCRRNTTRNTESDFYEAANDKPIPEKCPKLTYNGPAEMTDGYKCPVCGEYTNPYHLDADRHCSGCGYKLNV